MARLKTPRNPDNPEADRRLRRIHALYGFEPLLAFANAQLTSDSWAMACSPLCGTDESHARKILSLNLTIAGKHLMDLETGAPGARVQHLAGPYGVVQEIQSCVHRTLDRLMDGVADPLLDLKTGKIDFVVGGRYPGHFRGRCMDLQDYWLEQVSELIKRIRTARPLVLGPISTSDERGARRRRHGFPFRPLARCAEPQCRRFFFAHRADALFCMRKCQDRAAYKRRSRPPRRRPTYTGPPVLRRHPRTAS